MEQSGLTLKVFVTIFSDVFGLYENLFVDSKTGTKTEAGKANLRSVDAIVKVQSTAARVAGIVRAADYLILMVLMTEFRGMPIFTIGRGAGRTHVHFAAVEGLCFRL